MVIVDPEKTMRQCLYDSCSFNEYRATLDLSTIDRDYQKNFTNYYRVRRDAQWLESFYDYLRRNKDNKSISFEEILRYLSELEHSVRKTDKNPRGRAKSVEASFASKMLATINQDHPVWDSQVLRALGIQVDYFSEKEKRLEQCVAVYGKMEREIAEFIETDKGKECLAKFDEVFPDCKDFSNFKKMDFYLWNLGR